MSRKEDSLLIYLTKPVFDMVWKLGIFAGAAFLGIVAALVLCRLGNILMVALQ